ncbi:MAG: transporter, substrate-binding protein aliphatic sulfonates family, partial [Leifsonia sp.]|nr:transporter, substrate-binding protein aliphatic sulfonates family [Leifsonia sp.]
MRKRRIITAALLAGATAITLALTGCVAGEGAAGSTPAATASGTVTKGGTLNIDYATYNP